MDFIKVAGMLQGWDVGLQKILFNLAVAGREYGKTIPTYSLHNPYRIPI